MIENILVHKTICTKKRTKLKYMMKRSSQTWRLESDFRVLGVVKK